MPLPALAILLPLLFWDRPAATAPTLRAAGIDKIAVPPGRDAEWSKAGFTAVVFDRARAEQAVAPSVEYHMDVASATRVPWVNANGWRFARHPGHTFFYDAPAGSAPLAAAESFSYGVEAAIRTVPEDLPALARMLRFLNQIGQPDLPAMANIGVIDDGSDTLGEVLNLMARHNLLFRVIPAPDPKYDLNIRLGSAGYPADAAADPFRFAMEIRRRLTDEKRLLRVYGSNLVLAHLAGDSRQMRVHLLNYGGPPVKGLRVRVLGSFQRGVLADFGQPEVSLQDYASQDGATEFTIPELARYAVVDLRP